MAKRQRHGKELGTLYLHLLQKPEHKIAFMRLARLLAGADGFVARNERSYLHAFMDELGMSEETEPAVGGAADIETWLKGIRDDQVKHVFLAELMLLVLADGSMGEHEQRILEEVKRAFGCSDEVFERFKDWAYRMDHLRTEGVRLILDPTRTHG
jgi:DnaJ-domain-containing protein 1